MDKTLERILSLIPKNENGKFRHGAKVEFARNIGFASGEIVTMWINGSSKSYNNYLYEIAAKYNVSVEWLRGETDEQQPAQVEPEDELREYLEMLRSRPECRMLLSTVKGATKEEVEANVKLIEALRGFRG
jgi:hypothetical protein